MNLRNRTKVATIAIFLGGCVSILAAPSQCQSDTQSSSQGINKNYSSPPQSYESKGPTVPNQQSLPTGGSDQRKVYADRIRENYNFHFGADNISTPGNAKVV